MRILLLLFCCLMAAPVLAQDRAGNDTPGDWIVDHYRPFGLWDSICDYRLTGTVRESRCYIRYVEVFSQRPQFAAQFVFVTPGPVIEIGLEAGTRFSPDGIRIEDMGGILWSTDRFGCRFGFTCTFSGADADVLMNAMADGTVFAFDFTDRHGTARALRWDLTKFADAVADFRATSKARGL